MVNMENVERVKTFLLMLESGDKCLEDCIRYLRGADPTIPNTQAVNDYIEWLEEH
jgi:hypothetical protein